MPALLGCIEAALHELGCAAASLDETSSRAMPTEAMADRMHRGFMNMGLALADAELAATAARGLAGRIGGCIPHRLGNQRNAGRREGAPAERRGTFE